MRPEDTEGGVEREQRVERFMAALAVRAFMEGRRRVDGEQPAGSDHAAAPHGARGCLRQAEHARADADEHRQHRVPAEPEPLGTRNTISDSDETRSNWAAVLSLDLETWTVSLIAAKPLATTPL